MGNQDHAPPDACPPDVCPPSDVSAMVGLAGLSGLVAWVAVCRNWPVLAALWGLASPPGPLSGPYAAVVGLIAALLPMAAWSLLVDKVHRRPSTGIDWARPRPLAACLGRTSTKLAGLWATWALIACFYCLMRWYWQGQGLFAMHLLGALAVPAVILSVPYVLWLDRVLIEPRDEAWHFGAWLTGRDDHEPGKVRRHLRGWAVKGFFMAFMLMILPDGFAACVSFDWQKAGGDPAALAGWLTDGLFMIDVQIGTVGYFMTLRPLDAQIRSANPALGGWVAALICYPPFVLMNHGGLLDYHEHTADWSSWLAAWPALIWLWGGWLVLLTGVYAWATVAFGLRFSNLTYRGVLTNGPYRLTRHPAYLAKNLFWWSASMPFLATTHSPVDMVRNTAAMALVSAVYYWRAKTEEQHLGQEDAKYRAYSTWMEHHGLVTSRLVRVKRWLMRG